MSIVSVKFSLEFAEMALNLQSRNLYKHLYITSRRYCQQKSIYEREEEGKQPRMVHGKVYPEWRKPWIQREGEWSSKLSLFIEKNPSPYIMNALQKLPTISIKDIKDWWAEMKVIQEIENQRYLPERVLALGKNLAAVHFFTFRQAAVRLKGEKEWIFAEDVTTLNLPGTYVEGYFVEAVDCSKFHHNGIRFEGLQNLTGLNYLKWLSLKNNKYVDVWCLDRIAGQNGSSLEYLDIQGCNVCINCVYAISRMPALKVLVLTDPGDNVPLQAVLSILEEQRPNLLIKAVSDTDSSKDT